MIKNANVSIEDSSSDLIIIPHSTGGTVSANFTPFLKRLKLEDSVPKDDLGSFTLVTLDSNSKVRYIGFACSVNDFTSTYASIYQVIKNLSQILPTDVKSIALPLLGTGAGELDKEKAYLVLRNAISELINKNIEVVLHVLDKPFYNNLSKLENIEVNKSAKKLVFDFTIDGIKKLSWVKEQLDMPEFYFEKARDKFNDFLKHAFEVKTYRKLEEKFSVSNLVFSKFLYTYPENSPEYEFLTLCGQVIAYIDRHAYNKNIWNEYKDKRTLARSSVNQTRWIKGLINFKASKNDFDVLSPSIRNAFEYLGNPDINLTMLSSRHRLMAGKTLFNAFHDNQVISAVNIYFREKMISCENQDNNGSLYSRILYIPEIKELWLDEDETIAEQIEETDILPNDPHVTVESADVAIGEDAESIRQRNLQLLMHSDIYAKIDLLNYEIYASIIARLITSKLSSPPFNISIMAPWGKGKTTLMRFIEKKLHPVEHDKTVLPDKSFLWRNIIKWSLFPAKLEKEFKSLEHPVIWFNAWKFQKSEQVWAGLADEIIKQLADRHTPINRQKFWFKLNLSRIDRDKVIWDIVLTVLRKIILPIAYVIGAVLLYSIFKAFEWGNVLSGFLAQNPSLIAAVPLVAGIIAAVQKLNIEWSKPPDIDLSKFISRPEYRSKTGYLQAVEDDLKKAIEIGINPDKPAVIFIDDLDRCSPAVIADVVEAINAFMSGELSKCYFIIGQDPTMVTASLDAAYEKIAGKIGQMEGKHSSIGRYFLEKFSQLTINVPIMGENTKRSFIESLLSSLDQELIPDKKEQTRLLGLYEVMQQDIRTANTPEQIFTEVNMLLEAKIKLFSPQLVMNFQEEILSNAFKSYNMDDNELENVINEIADYLDSPRTIKRFLNLFLFYHFFRYTFPGRDLVAIDNQTMSKWLLIMVRWPLLVQAIQWDTEKGFFTGSDCSERAQNFDDLIDQSQNYQDYKAAFRSIIGVELTWQCDEDLYKICKGNQQQPIKISAIVSSGIW